MIEKLRIAFGGELSLLNSQYGVSGSEADGSGSSEAVMSFELVEKQPYVPASVRSVPRDVEPPPPIDELWWNPFVNENRVAKKMFVMRSTKIPLMATEIITDGRVMHLDDGIHLYPDADMLSTAQGLFVIADIPGMSSASFERAPKDGVDGAVSFIATQPDPQGGSGPSALTCQTEYSRIHVKINGQNIGVSGHVKKYLLPPRMAVGVVWLTAAVHSSTSLIEGKITHAVAPHRALAALVCADARSRPQSVREECGCPSSSVPDGAAEE